MSDGPTRRPGDDEGGDTDRGSILAPAPVLFALAFVVGVVLDRFERIEVLPRPLNFLAGGLSAVAGTALFVDAIRRMQSAGTGPSHGDDPPAVITEGVFRYSRNPIYLGNCLQYVGLSALYNSAWRLAVFVPLLAYFDRVIDREESYLELEFGEEFERYRETVPRWF